MQKKLYIGGLPWEIDRIGLLNYVKVILEENDIAASYELPFIASPLVNPNSVLKVTDVFVALDRETNKSRGFGFVTLDFQDESDAENLFEKITDLMNERIQMGIRGPRELIVKEADPRPERDEDSGNNKKDDDSTMSLDW